MTLRATIFIFLCACGFALVAMLGLQGWSAYESHAAAVRASVVNNARQGLLGATITLREARFGLEATDIVNADRLEIVSNPAAHVTLASDKLEMSISSIQDATFAEAIVHAQRLVEEHAFLSALQTDIQGGMSERELARTLGEAVVRLTDLRIEMLMETDMANVPLALLHLLRTYVLTVHDRLLQTAIILLQEVVRLEQQAIYVPSEALQRHTGQAAAIAEALDEIFSYFENAPTRASRELATFMQQDYSSAEIALAAALLDNDPDQLDGLTSRWWTQKQNAHHQITATLAMIDAAFVTQVETLENEARSEFHGWISLSGAAILAYSAAAAAIWLLVAQPLLRINRTIFQLAEGDLSRVPARQEFLIDLRKMSEALRVFRVNALRRNRLQNERMQLHQRIAAAHAELNAELRAAAVVQKSQLPEAGELAGFQLSTLYRPSRLLAGDSYDFVSAPKGGVRIFQIDVAGHGAAASLVSVAAHIGIKRALEALPPGGDLGQMLEMINANWSNNLVYFTAVIIELNSEENAGRMVQAGHPYPAILRGDGSVDRLGQGGVPVGVLPHGDFQEVSFEFAQHDRLFIFTDGLYEAANPQGQAFGEGRFIDSLGAYAKLDTQALIKALNHDLADWRSSEEMDDDISLVIAERV